MNSYNFDYLGYSMGNFVVPSINEIRFERSKTRVFFKLPLELNLNHLHSDENKISHICNLNGTIKVNTKENSMQNYLLATFGSNQIFSSNLMERYPMVLSCETNISDILELERLRNGYEFCFNIELHFLNYFLLEDDQSLFQKQSSHRDQNLYIEYPIPQKVWIEFINKLNLFEYHLFELNNPIQDSEEMKHISSSVREAIHFFYQGGPMNWKFSVQKVREAMNHLGNFKKVSNDKKTKEKTRDERWLDYFLALKALPNLAVHSEDDIGEWSREEAQSILTSFLSIWNLRDSIFGQPKKGQVLDE